jgi:hypothetical protein
MDNLKIKIKSLADEYSKKLETQIEKRMTEMRDDDKSHYLIYQVLGISPQEGSLIDTYQNKGRFLYKYAGSFLEEVTILCFIYKFENAQKKVKIQNTLGQKPKTFEIDCLIGNKAYEIKWRDATTDGDHITKEHTRVKVIQDKGLTPIRLMFYSPNRTQAIKIQDTLKTLYKGVNGEYYSGEEAWHYLKETTGVDLKQILLDLSQETVKKVGNL